LSNAATGVFGKSGTKSFLTRLLLSGIGIRKQAAVNLIFDMHSENMAGKPEAKTKHFSTVKGLRQLRTGWGTPSIPTPLNGVRVPGTLHSADQIEVEDIVLVRNELNLSS